MFILSILGGDLYMFNKEDSQLLNIVSETADMAKDSTQQVLEKTTDATLKNTLQAQLKIHNDTCDKVKKIMHFDNEEAKKASSISKFQAQIVSKIKTLTSNDRTSTIAEMVIQGTTMGVTEITKELHHYQGTNLEIKTLAQQYLESLEKIIVEMKPFL
jgi:Domain of unknown function (DUF2383).